MAGFVARALVASLTASVALLPGSTSAAIVQRNRRQSITTLSTTQIDSYLPYTNFAAVGYCPASTTAAWSCGTLCEQNADFQPTASGGDGDSVQFWYVGFSPSLGTVIVAHQGTNTSDFLPLIEDADIEKENLDSTLFPGIDSSIEVHSGFAGGQASTANEIIAAVKTTMSTHDTSTITVVGHSLGAALAMLDAVMFTVQFPSATVKSIGYGQPRVGNQAFANYVDAHIDVTRINNKEDFVPILPGMFLGFHHPSGEIHIEDSGSWDACPGQDNESDLCTTGDVDTIFDGEESDHDGPYNGVELGGAAAEMCI